MRAHLAWLIPLLLTTPATVSCRGVEAGPDATASTGSLEVRRGDFHRRTFLKPLHESAEFCGSCHKVHLPEELNGYRWLRGQNHYDSFLLSGVSGHGVQSFYYPDRAEPNCNGCHMELIESDDFGAKRYDDDDVLSVHDRDPNAGFRSVGAGLRADPVHRESRPDTPVHEPHDQRHREAPNPFRWSRSYVGCTNP